MFTKNKKFKYSVEEYDYEVYEAKDMMLSYIELRTKRGDFALRFGVTQKSWGMLYTAIQQKDNDFLLSYAVLMQFVTTNVLEDHEYMKTIIDTINLWCAGAMQKGAEKALLVTDEEEEMSQAFMEALATQKGG